MHPHQEPPVNPLPPLVVALALGIFLIEVVFQAASRGFIGGAGGVSWRRDALLQYGFSDALFDRMLQLMVWDSGALMRMLTYSFVHYSMAQTLFLVVIVLALGKWVSEHLPQWTILVIFMASAVIGAAVYGLLFDTPVVLVGGFPGAYGLIGAFTFLLWTRLIETGGPQSRAFVLIGVLIAFQLIFGIVGGVLSQSAATIRLDWIADLAGFGAGFLVTILISPGGWRRMVDRLRQR